LPKEEKKVYLACAKSCDFYSSDFTSGRSGIFGSVSFFEHLRKVIGARCSALGQNPTFGLKCKKKVKFRAHKLAIFAIMTSQVDVAGYLGQFHFLNTSEKSLALDFKPFRQNPTFGLKCEKIKYISHA
jgi:hypothetical protein